MTVELCKYTKNHSIVHLTGVNVTVYELHLNKVASFLSQGLAHTEVMPTAPHHFPSPQGLLAVAADTSHPEEPWKACNS